jgi:hypothetical protein
VPERPPPFAFLRQRHGSPRCTANVIVVAVVAATILAATTAIRFTPSDAGAVWLGLYDLAGRRIVSLLDQAEFPPGAHETARDTRDWPPASASPA